MDAPTENGPGGLCITYIKETNLVGTIDFQHGGLNADFWTATCKSKTILPQ